MKRSHAHLLTTYCINTNEGCVETCYNGRMYREMNRPRAIRIPDELPRQ